MALIIVLRELLIIATKKRMSKLTGKDGEKVDDERSLIVVHKQACQAMTWFSVECYQEKQKMVNNLMSNFSGDLLPHDSSFNPTAT